jgi:mannosyl-3-phosphoglycerate phosphatase
MIVVFTDLDGTLLDRDTYSFQPAAPALQRLQERCIPVVLVTSKTLSEVELWRKQLGNSCPFVVENGAAVFSPEGNPPLPKGATQRIGPYDMVELGIAYRSLTKALKIAARESGCHVRGFGDMTAQEISERCDLSLEQAILAKARQYDEPFELIKGNVDDLQRAIERQYLRLTRGGRFFHITGQNDKADGVALLVEAYCRLGSLRTVGLGDGPNDVRFLNLVDYPVLLDSPLRNDLRRLVPRARIAPAGPRGWNESVLDILSMES